MTWPTRPRFTEGKFIGYRDLATEQSHREGVARRHHLGPHQWGIVSGLQLQQGPDSVRIDPGYAIDGNGVEMVLAAPVEIIRDDAPADSVHVWLTIDPHANGRPSFAVCVSDATHPHDATPTPVVQSTVDKVHLTQGGVKTRSPIYLGRVTWSDDVQVHQRGRRLAGLVGESVQAPSGQAALQIGAERHMDPARFVVSTVGQPSLDEDGDATKPALAPRLEVTQDGDLRVCGPSGWQNGLRLFPSPPVTHDSHSGLEFLPSETPPADSPWTVYRTPAEPSAPDRDQLRLEIGSPAEDEKAESKRLVVGSHRDADKPRFAPCLSVDANCTVTIAGDLTVQGRVVEAPVPGDPADPRLVAAAQDQIVQGMLIGAARISEYYSAGLTVALDPEQGE